MRHNLQRIKMLLAELQKKIADDSISTQESEEVTCTYCKKVFPSRPDVNNHMVADHPDIIVHINTETSEQVAHLDQIMFFTGSICDVVQDYNYATCDQVFNSKKSSKKHMIKKHTAIEKHAYEICERVTNIKTSYPPRS